MSLNLLIVRIWEAIAEGGIEHPDHTELNRHVLAAAPKFYGTTWKFVKPPRKKLPIDGVVALAMAVRVLRLAAAPGPVDDEVRGPNSTIYIS